MTPTTDISSTRPTTAAVVGAGAFGTAIAKLLSDGGVATYLWAREPEVVESIETGRENEMFLPGVHLARTLLATTDLGAALEGADVVVSAVPTQYVRSVLSGAADELRDAELLITVSKGIETDTLLTPAQILADVLPGALTDDVVSLSGPSFATEVAASKPTAVVAASRNIANARRVRDLFTTKTFRVYSSDDVVGVELGGAVKNVIAIAAGISEGLGYGQNALAALIARGLAEITRLGVALGAQPATFSGLAGMGDLLLTCTGQLSRNRSLGLALGTGSKLEDMLSRRQTVAEGVTTTVTARALAERIGVEMPITEQVYVVLYEDKDPATAARDLMAREPRDERDG